MKIFFCCNSGYIYIFLQILAESFQFSKRSMIFESHFEEFFARTSEQDAIIKLCAEGDASLGKFIAFLPPQTKLVMLFIIFYLHILLKLDLFLQSSGLISTTPLVFCRIDLFVIIAMIHASKSPVLGFNVRKLNVAS